jgi:magnesium chelatase accessory protein
MTSPLTWATDGRDWPHRAHSHFVAAGGLHWHVQRMGSGPPVLLLHGTGASTHSWRDLMPRLAEQFALIVPDLPGHAFTERAYGAGLSLAGMAQGVSALLKALDVAPVAAVGHSAGGAVAIRMALDGGLAPRGIIGLNAALLPFPGMAGQLFPTVARLLFANPLSALLLSRRAMNRDAIARVIAGTGSRLDAEGLDLYAKLFRNSAHVAAVLGMMSKWDLDGLTQALPHLEVPLALMVGGRDKAVPPADAQVVAAKVKHTTITPLPGLGHLAHEEAPAQVAGLIADQISRWIG